MAKKIMLQRTGSSVGKSLVTAAFCRMLNNQGYRVAPFKSQNMALNSFITQEGLEMGRAQVVQAEAARIEPSVDMNPILLKPTSDTGSQVILNGRIFKNESAAAYFNLKDRLMPEVIKAFKRLEETFEVIVIEGAGSPAEINLRSRDIVNMGLAEAVDTDVLLVGDVDKGGVFAAIYGTFMLLEPEERKRVKGYIINKFRGDVSLLMPGVEMLSEKIGIPCMGVLPFIHDLGIDDEDSVSDRLASKRREASTASEQVEVGVIRLPYLSNFTDFTSLEQMSDVNLSYLDRPSDAEFCDLLIIPGSKSTVHDMRFLAESGFNEAIYKAHRRGTAIMGICGGFQMLGTEISDPKGVESGEKSINGLGILPVKTVMSSEKQTVQCTGTLAGAFVGEETARSPVSGYEIHMGRTEWMTEDEKGQASMRPAIIKADGMPDGCMDRSGQVMGTYLHGIFDSDAFRNDLIRALRYKKGLHTDFSETAYAAQKESAYDRLTAIFERHLDRAAIASVLEASRPTP